MAIWSSFTEWWSCDEAQDIAEYAVLVAVVLVIVAITASAVGTSTHQLISKASAAIGSIAK